MWLDYSRVLLILALVTGCGKAKEPIVDYARNAKEKSTQSFFVGRVCGGDTVFHDFHVTFAVGLDTTVEIGEFKSSCSCFAAEPHIVVIDGICTLTVPVSWRTPSPRVQDKIAVERQVVESKGFVWIGEQYQEVEMRLFGDICAPVKVNSNPIRLVQGNSGTRFEVYRAELSPERFGELQLVLGPGFECKDQFRDGDKLRCELVTAGSNFKNSSITITGLSDSLVIPIIVSRVDKPQLVRDIVFAEKKGDVWISVFEFEGSGEKSVTISERRGGKLDAKNLSVDSLELSLTEAAFTDGLCEVILEFRNRNGETDTVNARVWQNVEH